MPTYGNNLNNLTSGFGNYLQDLYKNVVPTTQGTNPYPVQNYNLLSPGAPTSYQVKPGDTFASIGSQFGMDETKLQESNKMVVPPPKGSFISIPSVAQTQTNALRNPSLNTYYNSERGQAPLAASPASPMGANSFTSGANVNLNELTFNIQNQIQNGIAPQSVPSQLLGQLGATPQSMAANGYVLNPANNTWVLGGTGAPTTTPGSPTFQSGNNWMTNPALHMVRYGHGNRNKGYVTEKWLKNARRRQRRGGSGPAPVLGQASNAGGSPVSTLDVRLGSG